jgi:hypothetical protein
MIEEEEDQYTADEDSEDRMKQAIIRGHTTLPETRMT